MLEGLMERYALTRYSLAQKAGVSTRAISKWLDGSWSPTVASAVKVARVFDAKDGAALLEDWGYGSVDLLAVEDPSSDVLDLILAEVRVTNGLLRRLDGFVRHATREGPGSPHWTEWEQGEQPYE